MQNASRIKGGGRVRFHRSASLILCGALCLLVLGSCQAPSSSGMAHEDIYKGSGTMFVAYNGFAYRIGGLEESGQVSAVVEMTTIDAAGTIGTWKRSSPLPEGRSHGAAFATASASGTLIYVLGGEGPGGPSSSVYFNYINQDGSLGFNGPGRWETAPRSLPEPRSYAPWVLYDGRVFLIGGRSAKADLDSIIQARLYQDGQVGQWYTSPAALPSPRYATAAAVLDVRLFVAGGRNSASITNEVQSYSMGNDGLLGDPRKEAPLPLPLFSLVLLADQGALIAAGGCGNAGPSSAVFREAEGSWNLQPEKMDAENFHIQGCLSV